MREKANDTDSNSYGAVMLERGRLEEGKEKKIRKIKPAKELIPFEDVIPMRRENVQIELTKNLPYVYPVSKQLDEVVTILTPLLVSIMKFEDKYPDLIKKYINTYLYARYVITNGPGGDKLSSADLKLYINAIRKRLKGTLYYRRIPYAAGGKKRIKRKSKKVKQGRKKSKRKRKKSKRKRKKSKRKRKKSR